MCSDWPGQASPDDPGGGPALAGINEAPRPATCQCRSFPMVGPCPNHVPGRPFDAVRAAVAAHLRERGCPMTAWYVRDHAPAAEVLVYAVNHWRELTW